MRKMRESERMPFGYGIAYKDFSSLSINIAPYPICWIYRLWIYLLFKTKFLSWEKKVFEKQEELIAKEKEIWKQQIGHEIRLLIREELKAGTDRIRADLTDAILEELRYVFKRL